jgi:hypothetical protein
MDHLPSEISRGGCQSHSIPPPFVPPTLNRQDVVCAWPRGEGFWSLLDLSVHETGPIIRVGTHYRDALPLTSPWIALEPFWLLLVAARAHTYRALVTVVAKSILLAQGDGAFRRKCTLFLPLAVELMSNVGDLIRQGWR